MAPREGSWEWTTDECDIPIVDGATYHRCGHIALYTIGTPSNLLKKELNVRYNTHTTSLEDHALGSAYANGHFKAGGTLIIEAFTWLGVQEGEALTEEEVTKKLQRLLVLEKQIPTGKLIYVLVPPTHEFEWPRITNPRLKHYNKLALSILADSRWKIVDVWSPLAALPTARGMRAIGYAMHASGVEFAAYTSQIMERICSDSDDATDSVDISFTSIARGLLNLNWTESTR